MVAAYEMRRAGYEVEILEYQQRAGGRCWTIKQGDTINELGGYSQTCNFSEGQYINIGPWRIPHHHRAVLDYCQKLGVQLEVFVQEDQNAYLHSTTAFGGRPQRYANVWSDYVGGVSELLAKSVNQGALADTVSVEDTEMLLESLKSFGVLDGQYRYTERLENDPAVSRIDSAPMLRGVVTRINDRPAAEVAGDHWVVSGDRGVTYAAAPKDGALITAGEWWAPDYTGPPQISFAAEEAEEMGLDLGDTITINVLGRDITGTITSFQEVDFSTAGIGFILTMNPSALSGAPHTFISTVYAEPEAEARILRDLASQYPNITAIRVKDAIDRVAGVLAGLAAATSYGAAATLLTGFLVLIGAAAAGADARTYEAAMLKTMGASRRMIAASFILRAALLGFAAGAVALLAGVLGGWAVSTFVMETDYVVIWRSALLIIAGGIVATVIAGLGFARRALQARPARVLRARE
jgi:putative ABC transport system permease protein